MHRTQAVIRHFATTLFIVLTAAGAARAETLEVRAQAFVRDGIDQVLEVLKERQTSKPEKLAKLRAIFRRHFDHRTIARFAAGPHYAQATPTERRRYLKALEDFVVSSYGRRMLKYSEQIDMRLKASDVFKITSTSPVGRRDIYVHSHINRALLKPVRISWRLRRRHSEFRIVDVTILGISQILLYRSDFTSEIRRRGRGLSGLTTVLIAKTGDGDAK